MGTRSHDRHGDESLAPLGLVLGDRLTRSDWELECGDPN